MKDNTENQNTTQDEFSGYAPVKKKSRYSFLINIGLFILTFFTTTIAGVGWLNTDPYQLENIIDFGVLYLY